MINPYADRGQSESNWVAVMISGQTTVATVSLAIPGYGWLRGCLESG